MRERYAPLMIRYALLSMVFNGIVITDAYAMTHANWTIIWWLFACVFLFIRVVVAYETDRANHLPRIDSWAALGMSVHYGIGTSLAILYCREPVPTIFFMIQSTFLLVRSTAMFSHRSSAELASWRPRTLTRLEIAQIATPAMFNVIVSLYARDLWFGLVSPFYTFGIVIVATLFARQTRELVDAETEEKRLNALLRQLTLTDPLTGIANRRAFDEHLQASVESAARHGSFLSLLLIDVDFFKKMNDLSGHKAGDECLKAIALRLKTTAADEGFVARYGGEEFAVIAPDADLEAITGLAERLRMSIIDLNIPHAGSSFGVLTISIGFVTMHAPAFESGSDLIKEADQALYLAKAGGRNRVAHAMPIPALLAQSA